MGVFLKLNSSSGSSVLSVARLILFNKPYGVLSQFTPEGRWQGLRDHLSVPGVYAAGRLDADSEGLLILTDDGTLQSRIADPKHKLPKTYWAQVEGEPDDAALDPLRQGVDLGDFVTRRPGPIIDEPAGLWPRTRRPLSSGHRPAGSNSSSRGQEPPGATNDGQDRLPDAAADSRRRRGMGSGELAARRMERKPCLTSGCLTSSLPPSSSATASFCWWKSTPPKACASTSRG
jgi:hypothetical protein